MGSQRVGIARGSSAARIAQPLTIVPANQALDELFKLAQQTDGLVVGLPRGLEGQETAQTKNVRQWVKRAKAKINKPFYWQDEALTSVNNDGDDAVAASIILQNFLDTPSEDRVKA